MKQPLFIRRKGYKCIAWILSMALIFLLGGPVFSSKAASLSGKSYYISASTGNDANSGVSENEAWKTLEKVNSMTFQPGDRILFRAGDSWSGQLWPKGSGTEGAPIEINSYGVGSKPLINGGGVSDTLYLFNQEYFEINNLEITNIAQTEGVREGIRVMADITDRFLYHIVIRDCYIHDVTGTMSRKDTGGIIVRGNFDGVLIERNTVRNVYRTGILTGSKRNTVVRNNMVDSIGGDGIQIGGGSMSPLVEYNVAKDCYNRYTRGEYNVAIWPYETNDAVFQYNEAYLTRNTLDGQGFDCDYLCNGTIFQYNYSHDNEGGFMLICSIPNAPDYESYNRNSIIRYNISQNDKNRIFQIHSRGTQGTQIYNNTIYVGEGLSPKIYDFDLFRQPGTVYSYNNIFYNAGKGTYSYGTQKYHVFENNLFYGYHPSNEPSDPYKITADPMLVAPGTGGIGRDTVAGYMLQPGSPAINAGKYISGNGGLDYWGNPLYNGAPDIGANEYSGQQFEPILRPYEGLKISHGTSGSGENQINYTGSWQSSSNDHWSNQVNATYSVTFTGKQVKIYGPKDPAHGIMAVSIDGGAETLIDTYAPTRMNGEILFASELMNMGTHTLKVRVTGEKNASSSNSYIDVAQVEVSPTYRVVKSYNAGAKIGKIDYIGNWKYGDNDSWCMDAGAYYIMTFKGTKVRLIGVRDVNFATIAISIDGGAETFVNTASTKREGNFTLFESPELTEGVHTIKVRITEPKGHTIDRLEYLPVQDSIYEISGN